MTQRLARRRIPKRLNGTGLGLSMTHDIIVKQHGGRIDVATEPGQFTDFIIVLQRKSNLSGRDRGET
jgi:signal transduction histidine kinase